MSEHSCPPDTSQPAGESPSEERLADYAAERDTLLLALDALRDSESRLRLALDASDMGTFVWRIPEDRGEPDRRMLALFGLPAGRTMSLAEITNTLIHPDDRLRFADAFVNAIDGDGCGALSEEFRILHSDRSVRWLGITGRAMFEEVRSPSRRIRRRAVRMSGVAVDITDRKRREADLALLDRIADDSARLSTAEEIIEVVGARVGGHLHASSVCLVEVDDTRDELRIVHMWNEEGTPTRPDVVRISDFVSADFRADARAGNAIVVGDTENDPRTHATPHSNIQVRSFISVPFIRDGAWKFMLTVCDSRPHLWRDDDVTLFRQLADRLFARVEIALAEQALANDLRDTQLLRDLSVRLVSESDTQAFFDAIVAAAISITDAKAGALQLLDAESNELALLATQGFDEQLTEHFGRLTAVSATCSPALASGPLAFTSLDDPDRRESEGPMRWQVDIGIRSVQSTPLVTRAGRAIGMLSTYWGERQRRPSDRELRFLDLLARQAAEMIERRRSDNALRESERRLSAELADTQLLQRLSAQLIEEQGSASLYETLVDGAKTIMRSEFASMQMLYPDLESRGDLRLIASRGFDDEAKRRWEWVRADQGTTCARALQTAARVIAPDIASCEFMAGTIDQATQLEAGIRAAQTTPLVSRAGKMLGMITTHWAVPHQPSERDFRLLDILARQAADLMERTQADEALRRSESQLKEADRRKDEFLATLAHELRNPLAPLRTSLELIRLGDNTPEAVKDVRVMMEEQVALLVRLVDDLLDVSRITSGKIRLQRRPTDLAALVATAVQANRSALDAGRITLSLDLPDSPVLLDADPPRFVQVVSNVLHNAVKFTDPGGEVRITAEVTQSADGDAREVVVSITDSGVGISKEMLSRVFELFTQDDATTYRSITGLGVGLALSRHLIEMHGGSIEAHSDGSGLGSTFRLRMPMAHGVADTDAGPRNTVAPRITRRVVVIDDNPAAARALQRLVTALGGECRMAHDGESGLTQIRESRPEVVILDIGMPGLDGYDTCRRIRDEFGSNVLVVALTGWGQERDKQRAMRAGFDVHLTKPADPIMLEELLAGTGGREATDRSLAAAR